MTTQLAFGTLSCGPNGSVAQAPAALTGRRVCTHTSPAATPSTRSVAAPAAPPPQYSQVGRT